MKNRQGNGTATAGGQDTMTRGRPPQNALDEALPIARGRGRFLQFTDEQPFGYDFFFMSGERICLAWVKRTRHIWCPPEELERQCAGAVAKYRELPLPAGLTREIWFWSPYGIFRFFRIEDDGLVEIGRDGKDLARTKRKPGAMRKTEKRELRPRAEGPQGNATPSEKPAGPEKRRVKAKGTVRKKTGEVTSAEPGERTVKAEEPDGNRIAPEKTMQMAERRAAENPVRPAGEMLPTAAGGGDPGPAGGPVQSSPKVTKSGMPSGNPSGPPLDTSTVTPSGTLSDTPAAPRNGPPLGT